MSLIKPCESYYQFPSIFITKPNTTTQFKPRNVHFTKKTLLFVARCSSSSSSSSSSGEARERKSFLTLEEAGLVEISGLDSHEKFLCRLTISSLNLLRVISEQEGCPIEELNAGRVCDWFLKDKLKREQNIGSAVLQWGDSDLQF